MVVYAATQNAGKLRELRAIFAMYGWDVLAFDGYAAPDEGESSYADNARLKAHALRAALREAAVGPGDAWVVGDDSGLEVCALDGRPGVLSARYGGDGATWADRRRQILTELGDDGDRRARFVCAMHLIAPDGTEYASHAAVDGEIAHSERGKGGFSYDAIFLYPPLGKTFGELPEQQKNSLSHRRRAVEALLRQLTTATSTA